MQSGAMKQTESNRFQKTFFYFTSEGLALSFPFLYDCIEAITYWARWQIVRTPEHNAPLRLSEIAEVFGSAQLLNAGN